MKNLLFLKAAAVFTSLSLNCFAADSFVVHFKSEEVMSADQALQALRDKCSKEAGTTSIKVDVTRFYLFDESISDEFPATDVSALCIKE